MDVTCDLLFVTGRMGYKTNLTANSCSSHNSTSEAGSEAVISRSFQQVEGISASCAYKKSKTGRSDLLAEGRMATGRSETFTN